MTESNVHLAVPVVGAAATSRDLHAEIMNLPCQDSPERLNRLSRIAYRIGHRDARHAAAELVDAALTDAYAQGRADEAAEADSIRALASKQAEDDGLWFVALRASEAYLQSALRDLHAAIEGCAKPSGKDGA